ncbi:unnamed protein product [Didymodactylos carnosus]|uniref:Uncharacterized protein n=1 Tax=Didymodactylos carnosus TaxID=1234261 RepID=A0A815I523_9BILA|nr:unnamed protein product [Didymodactylos carnosus]CAF1360804.1 unnamed protein product [Didymodactylos carnosus]CAF3721463.1 unnamed protein product [Didymodactylos carnosus]CAF4238950.1 unnamed protein product [Didymodactylos carnosus]
MVSFLSLDIEACLGHPSCRTRGLGMPLSPKYSSSRRSSHFEPQAATTRGRTSNFGADDPKLRQQWLDIIQNASKDRLKYEAQAIEQTIAETEAKRELLRDKLCEMREEREMVDVEREESVKLKETIESSWNKVFRLEMRKITPPKTGNEYESSDDVAFSSIQNILGSNDLPNSQKIFLRTKLHRPRRLCFGYEFADVPIGRRGLVQLLKLVLGNNVFHFWGQYFSQRFATAMGTPCTPSFIE